MKLIFQHNNFPLKENKRFPIRDTNNNLYHIVYQAPYTKLIKREPKGNELFASYIPIPSICNTIFSITQIIPKHEHLIELFLNHPSYYDIDFFKPYIGNDVDKIAMDYISTHIIR